MRAAEEARVWPKLRRVRADRPRRTYKFGQTHIEFSEPCLVIGGLNGSGKSRVLRMIDEQLSSESVLIRPHEACEEVLGFLRVRGDIEEMTAEYEAYVPDGQIIADVQRIVRRDYEEIRWYSLEFAADEFAESGGFAAFRDGDDQVVVPYFEAVYKGVSYSSTGMGLGEFSVHLMYWMLWRLREREGMTLLLDEPDAYLPPVGSGSLIPRLLNYVGKRDWSIVVATHSQEMISQASDNASFVYLSSSPVATPIAVSVETDPTVGMHLLPAMATKAVFFVEDESAMAQLKAIIARSDSLLAGQSTIVWGGGDGYARKLKEKLPRPPRPDVFFAFVLDGDQEVSGKSLPGWPLIKLPGGIDPDDAFRSLSDRHVDLARILGVSQGEVAVFNPTLEGLDSHDWVNRLSYRFGREATLRALAELWVADNEEICQEFVEGIRADWWPA